MTGALILNLLSVPLKGAIVLETDVTAWPQPPHSNLGGSSSIFQSRGLCRFKISVKCVCGCASGSHFHLNLVFLPAFVSVFVVQIVGYEAGLTVVSKLEVSNLIRGSINEILFLWFH